MKLFLGSYIILVGMVVFTLLSCNRPVQDSSAPLLPELQQAEAIMYASPDSALRLLQSMPVPQPSDRLQYATWALFTTQARYKLYMQQSDSLINIAYEYFLKQGDAQRRALALYYKGIICKEQQQIEEPQKGGGRGGEDNRLSVGTFDLW